MKTFNYPANPANSETNNFLSEIDGKIPSQGQNTSDNSLPVVIANDQSPIPVTTQGHQQANLPIRLDYSSTTVSTSAYTQLIASTTADINRLHIFDSSGQTMSLNIGASGSESISFLIPPGGIDIDYKITSGNRISLKAVSGNASVGEININFLT